MPLHDRRRQRDAVRVAAHEGHGRVRRGCRESCRSSAARRARRRRRPSAGPRSRRSAHRARAGRGQARARADPARAVIAASGRCTQSSSGSHTRIGACSSAWLQALCTPNMCGWLEMIASTGPCARTRSTAGRSMNGGTSHSTLPCGVDDQVGLLPDADARLDRQPVQVGLELLDLRRDGRPHAAPAGWSRPDRRRAPTGARRRISRRFRRARRARPHRSRTPPRIHQVGRWSNAGGGTRTPDTRIMIPRLFPVFTGNSGFVGH